MARIISVQKPILQIGDTCKVTINYTLGFTDFEIKTGMQFRDAARVMEEDDEPNADDEVTGWTTLATHVASATQEQRSISFNVSQDALDTEHNGEELYGLVRLYNVTLDILYPTKRGPYLYVSL